MHPILKQLRQLADKELQAISEAIDVELVRRLEIEDDTPDSARRRAVARQKSYRRTLGSTEPPVRAAGLGKEPKRRFAA